MKETPRVVLLMIPFAGYDRGLLEGIARYAQLHGPWTFICRATIRRCRFLLRIVSAATLSGLEYLSAMMTGMSLPNLRRWGAKGVIGRIQSSKMAKTLLASGLPVIGIDMPAALWRAADRLSKVSEICPDSRQAGRLAAEHFLERGFWNFAFCGYEGRVWSQRRQEGLRAAPRSRLLVPSIPADAAHTWPFVEGRVAHGHGLVEVAAETGGRDGVQ